MRVLLFNAQMEKTFRAVSVPLGLISIASFLNTNGHNVSIFDMSHQKEKPRDLIAGDMPDFVGVSVITYKAIKNAVEISKEAKALGVKVIWGGPMASVIPYEILETGLVDYVSIGEGEETWLEMAQKYDVGLPFDDIKGLAFLKDGKYFQTERRELMDLSVLPKLDWNLINPEDYFQIGYGCKKQIHMYYSKGCIGNCTFCYNNRYNCSVRRVRPLDYVIEEMRYLNKKYGVDGFEFTDDLMFANVMQMREFCNRLIDSGLNIIWSGYLRIGIVSTHEDFELMYKSGCRMIMFGVESGSEKVQRSLNKIIPGEKIVSTVSICKKIGIDPILTFMLGLPDEAEDDVKKTLSLIKLLDGAIIFFNLYTPLPGTETYNNLIQSKGYEPPRTLEEFSKIRFGEIMSANFSNVKTSELYIIRNYFTIKGLLVKSSNSAGEQLLKMIKNILKLMMDKGVLNFFKTGFFTGISLLQSFSLFLHPKVRKKYGLYFKKKT